MLLFSSGNIICTGKISLDESKDAFRKIEDTLTSIGCKVAE
jgi:TATA-box binding protein (TBP) (component of TFIID and TFIIIB)